MRFNIGDRVKIISCADESIIGKFGTVSGIDTEWIFPYEITFEDDSLNSLDGETLFDEDELELANTVEITNFVEDIIPLGVTPPTPILRKEVLELACKMESVLQAKDHLYPNGWNNDSIIELWFMLDNKSADLRNVIRNRDGNEVEKLCVDIANYAMMINDKIEGEKKK